MFNTSYLNNLRKIEVERLLPLLPAGGRILDFGAGTGEQARFLASQGFDVVAVDLVTSDYATERVFPVLDYDGREIPLEDHSVDAVFSSNVLEHVEDIPQIMSEFHRITRRNGIGLHVMPTPAWRLWSFGSAAITSVQAAGLLPIQLISPPDGTGRWTAARQNLKTFAAGLIPRGHGTSFEGISEFWTFSPDRWRRTFKRYGFDVIEDRALGLFYTGSMLFADRLSFAKREQLGRILGSATHFYKVKPMASGHCLSDC